MKKFIIIALLCVLVSPVVIYAQTTAVDPLGPPVAVDPPDPENKVLPKITNPLKKEFSDIPSLVNGLVKIALQVGTIVAVLALVWVGFKFILAQGNPGEIEKARQALWWVIIGIAILFGAQIIVEIIKGTLSDFVDPSKIKF